MDRTIYLLMRLGQACRALAEAEKEHVWQRIKSGLENAAIPLRFWNKIRVSESGCWEWTASKTTSGYAEFSYGGRLTRASRYIYSALIGPIPVGLTLDHLCRNRTCVNPYHLEPVTMRENILRGIGLTAQNAQKTACIRGHPFDLFNTRIRSDGTRQCRRCDAIESRLKRQRRRNRGGESCGSTANRSEEPDSLGLGGCPDFHGGRSFSTREAGR